MGVVVVVALLAESTTTTIIIICSKCLREHGRGRLGCHDIVLCCAADCDAVQVAAGCINYFPANDQTKVLGLMMMMMMMMMMVNVTMEWNHR